MSGIAGILWFGDTGRDVTFLRDMADAMRRRGPDDEGYALFAGNGQAPLLFGGESTPSGAFDSSLPYGPKEHFPGGLDGLTPSVGLAHRRLAALDRSHRGHQPMCTPDGRYWIVYNGTMYTYQKLRDELSDDGPPFQTETDTEVILRAFARWGPACLDRFNGEYAFAIWDRQEKRLFCARDRMAIRPFYYHLTADHFLFASEIQALLAAKLFPPEIDPDGFYHGSILQMAPRPITAFKGIRSLEGAHWMVVTQGGQIEKQRYWTFPVGPTDHARSEESWAEEYEQLLDSAIRKRLIGDVEVGTYMSGGIDSTTIAAMASRHQPGIKAFTLSHDANTGMDELSNAEATAAMHNITHFVKHSASGYEVAFDEDMMRAHEEPFISLQSGMVLTSFMAEHGVTALLGGLGPDQILGSPLFAKHMGLWRLCRLGSPLLAHLPDWGTRWGKLRRLASQSTAFHLFVHRYGTFWQAKRDEMVDPDLAAQVQERDTAKVLIDLFGLDKLRFEDGQQLMAYMQVVALMCNRLLHSMDQETAYFGLELRYPFLDHNVVEFMARTPRNMRDGELGAKHVLRVFARKYIDASCFLRKRGFSVPMHHWVLGPLRDFCEEKLKALRTAGLYRPEAVDEVRGWLGQGDGVYPEGYFPVGKVWQLVSTQIWLEGFFGAAT